MLLIQILDSSEIKRDFLSDTLNLCHAYAILNWCCETVVPNNAQLISLMQLLLLNKPDISMQPLILDTIWSTLQYLYPLFLFYKILAIFFYSFFNRLFS